MGEEESSKKIILLVPMTVEKLAEELGKPTNSVILFLLKSGVVATKNKVLSAELVERVAKEYEFETTFPLEVETVKVGLVPEVSVEGDRVERLPIVVVIGHVDHGKTTLLDFIRKTKVVTREKGGITQHIGVYKAETKHGDIIFLDTPGHEAFSVMRARGVSVADIAVLIVAADDGVMPQTIEAIKYAQAAGLPVIVAINKVDKASEKQIEAVKRQLANNDLLPEEWGGQTVCIEISALEGTGVEDLLGIIVLQSKVMELSASTSIPAVGYVLESKIEKGRGAVATVICQHGILSIGDYFSCGSTWGRVNSMIDWSGKIISSAEPSIPVQVAGFKDLPKSGDSFRVGAKETVQKVSAEKVIQRGWRQFDIGGGGESIINLVVKADTGSSLEALVDSIQKMSDRLACTLFLLSTGVGAISESDVLMASDTGSIIYGLHVRMQPNALSLAKKVNVKVKLFDIIYKLLEDIEELGERCSPVEIRLEKIGEASILKVFDIKKIGKIAGARIVNGYCTKGSFVVIRRGKDKVGEGKIVSLQREREPAKEVRKGFECAFSVDNFDDWQVDDNVECYQSSEKKS